MKRFLILLGIFLLPVTAFAVTNPFVPVAKHIVSYFTPLEGDVIGVNSDVVINIGRNRGIKKGMRFKVFERGASFYHPVTGEYMGRIERFRGVIEVKDVSDNESRCRIVEGDAKKGDLVRISGAKTRVLFYQDMTVDYFIGDALYQELKDSGRFDLSDAPIENLSLKELLSIAEKEKTEAIIKLTSPKKDVRERIVDVSLLWKDGEVFFKEQVPVSAEFIREVRSSQEFLTGGVQEPLLLYSLPFGAEHILTGDVDGDKKLDIVLSNGYDIYVYSYDVDLSYLYQATLNKQENALWLDIYDIDRDGRDEIIISTINDDETSVVSYIFKFNKRKLKQIWKTEGFLRVLDGKLLWQAFSPYDGYIGKVREIIYNKGTFENDESLDLPPDLNIYNFVMIHSKEGELYFYVDKYNHLVLLNNEGLPVWRSEKDLGGFVKKFNKKQYIEMVERGQWVVPDRMIVRGRSVIVPARTPIAKKAQTLGYKESEIRTYTISGSTVDEISLINDINGNLIDFSVFGDKIAFVDKPPFGFVAKNLLRGKNPFVIYLQIFSIK